MIKTTQFLGLECAQLENASISLLVTKDVGPRILALSFQGRENLLAELPEATLDFPGGGAYHLYGGHRLWHAPEVRRRTYLPDDDPVTIELVTNGLRVIQPTQPQTGIQKSMHISLPDESPTVVIDHVLSNQGLWPLEFAPWAITKLKTGGAAILPQRREAIDPDGLQANRPIVLWPYTQMNSPHIQWGDGCILVDAHMESGALKIGFPNPRGWLAYWRQGTLYVKFAAYDPDGDYYDFQSSSQCYCNPRNLELETLGPRTLVQPGGQVRHREVWRLFGDIPQPQDENTAQRIVEELGLDRYQP